MRMASEIRVDLYERGEDRRRACEAIEDADARLATVLAEARSHPEITVSAAAEIALISRPMAYKLMAKVGGSES